MKVSMLRCLLIIGCFGMTVISSCATSVPCSQGTTQKYLLTLTFDVDDERDGYFRSLANAVKSSGNWFRVCFDNGVRCAGTEAILSVDDSYRACIQTRKAIGECIIFREEMILSHDTYADDFGRSWLAIVGSTGNLQDSLKQGGKGCYIAIAFNGTNPPNSLITVDSFESVETRTEGSRFFFKIVFTNKAEEFNFPNGRGCLIGMLDNAK